MAVTVKITETFDMKTTVNKMGLVGVHTPQVSQLRKLYPGLLKNFKFFRFVKCDVVGACASALPADPLQIGVTSGKVAPEDMFNPILYTAVSNASFDTLVARIRSLNDVSTLGSVEAGDAFNSTLDGDGNFKVYYSLLAEHGKWRKAMPQQGFRISGLVPLCHTILSTYGNVGNNMGNVQAYAPDEDYDMKEIEVPSMDIPDVDAGNAPNSWVYDADGSKAVYLRGKAVKMPRFPCHREMEEIDTIPYPNVPTTQVLALVLPPGKLNEFWYRMRVTWTVRFENVCSTLEAGSHAAFWTVGNASYGSNYVSSKGLTVDTDMVTGDNVEITKVMES